MRGGLAVRISRRRYLLWMYRHSRHPYNTQDWFAASSSVSNNGARLTAVKINTSGYKYDVTYGWNGHVIKYESSKLS